MILTAPGGALQTSICFRLWKGHGKGKMSFSPLNALEITVVFKAPQRLGWLTCDRHPTRPAFPPDARPWFQSRVGKPHLQGACSWLERRRPLLRALGLPDHWHTFAG